MSQAIEAKLEETRRQLLDLSRRNRLLNHKRTGRGAVQIVDELPGEVFRILVGEGRKMQFRALEEAPADSPVRVEAAEEADDGTPEAEGPELPLAPIDKDREAADRHTDRFLQTPLEGTELQRRLVGLSRKAQSALQEQGCNILYLTLGLVAWQEAGDDRRSLAPLVFVPVVLERRNVNSRHGLRTIDEDVICNPCLIELARRQFQIDLPSIEIDEDFALDGYFQQMSEAIAGLEGWELTPEIALGCFSFAKFLMYRDLDPEIWPGSRQLGAHPLVRQLSGLEPVGGEQAHRALPDPGTLDEVVPPRECFQVMDADASQQVAALAAKQGYDLVIEGPPGTGKSQTITNIIAELLGAKKKVLFVAEKAAALEVVKRRLTGVGLGEFVLELHSRKTSKRTVLDELRRTLELTPDGGRATAPPDDSGLQLQRGKLNATVRALHDPLGGLEISPFEAISRAVALREHPEAQCLLPDLLSWTGAELADAEQALEALDRRLERVGDPAAHPWRGAELTDAPLTRRQQLRELLDALAEKLAGAREAAGALAGQLGLDAPTTPAATGLLAAAGGELVEAPVIPAEILGHRDWGADGGRKEWLAAGVAYARHKAVWSDEMIESAEELDWSGALARRRAHHASVLRWLRWSWYADGRLIRSHHEQGILPPIGKQLELLEALSECGQLANQVKAGEHRHAALFGEGWRGLDSDWEALSEYARFVPGIRERIEAGTLDRAATERVLAGSNRGALSDAVREARGALEQGEAAWQAWLEAIESSAERWCGRSWGAVSFEAALARVAEVSAGFDSLADWVDYRAVERPLRAGRVQRFLEWAESPAAEAARGRLGVTFLRHFYRLWIDQAFSEREALRGFRGEDHQALIERFAQADRDWITGMRERLSGMIRSQRPDMGYAAHKGSKLGVLQAEIRKKRRHMPLRRLLNAAGEVIQAIKPCFMMSPISVAQYLEPGGLVFDVVIFDEASQVEPADAYGAIARGQQAILVGDEKQLPPTSFFNKVASDDGSGDAEELSTGDLESILSLGVVRLPHRCRLRWHYRSKHQSLISFSNAEFYDSDLRVFPSPYTGCEVMGLTFRHVPDGVYLRGKGQYNPVEARTVAKAVIEHALSVPQLTLGVGAFSVQQQRAIEDELERLRRERDDPRLEAFFQSHEEEPFFVKNLETIQGDERDVIMLSVGYGPDDQGKLTMNFGPLNREGGWRRLNVLVTRSKRRCVVFSSIRSDDIDLDRTDAPGVASLKRYLYAAEHGTLAEQGRSAPVDHAAFQQDLRAALEAAGWQVRTGVGVGRFAIDVAIVDPDHPERFLAGVECDGEGYRSVHTARDRDRLRRQVLEALGWKVERVWSVDWFQRRDQTLADLLGRLNEHRRAPRAYETLPEPEPEPEPAPEVVADFGSAPEPPPQAAPEPVDVIPYYRRKRRSLGDHQALVKARASNLIKLIAEIVGDEAPIHVDEVLRVITGLYGTRATKRPRAVYDEALEMATEQGKVLRRGEFLWRVADQAVPVRRRDGDCPVTRAELIAPEELAEAARVVVGRAFGIKQEALIESTAKLIGFSRRGKKLEAVITNAIALLHKQEAIKSDEQGFLTLA